MHKQWTKARSTNGNLCFVSPRLHNKLMQALIWNPCIFERRKVHLSSPTIPRSRLYLLLQGEGVLEVQQSATSRGARLPEVHPEGLHGLRRPACWPRLGLEPPGGGGTPLRQRRRRCRDQTGQHRGHGESSGHRNPLCTGTVHDGPPLHCIPVQEEEHTAPHTVLQALHAGVGLRDCAHCTERSVKLW